MDGLVRFLTHPVLVRLCQIAMGLIFGAAALAKIGDLGEFARSVHNFQLVPVATENLIALTLPWIELVAAVALVVGLRTRAAAILVTGLLALFTLAIFSAVMRDLSFTCGCFGKADAISVGWKKIGENLVMLVVGIVATFRSRVD